MIRFICSALIGWAILLAVPFVAQAQDATRVMIVMDGSGSMWGQIGQQSKLKIAKRAVIQLVKKLPPELELGLMAYGHRTEGDCDDIQVLVKPQTDAGAKIRRALNEMKFQGKTPLAASLREAAEELGYEDGPVTVVMVTDGLESCKMDPCEVAAELEADGFDFTAHVIGFGLTPKEGARVACIAKRTGGRYYPARNAKALARALSEAVMNEESPDASDQVVPGAEADDEPMADAEVAAESPDVAVAAPAPAAYFRGAPVMMNVALSQTGTIGIAAQSPLPQDFATNGTISDCQIRCEGDVLCAAWRYEPVGTTSADRAQCVVFDYAAALDYKDTDTAQGWASGMKVGAVQLVRPYVPTPVVAPVAMAEPEAAPVDVGPIMVNIMPAGSPEGLAITWTATPLDDPKAEVVAMESPVSGPWEAPLSVGEWAIEGLSDGFIFEDYITVSDTATEFQIDGFSTGADETAPVDEALVAEDEGAEDTMSDTDNGAEVDVAVETADDPPAAEEIVPMAQVILIPPDATLAFAGVETVTDAGYRCDTADPCGMQDPATGLVFALPAGWASDRPAFLPNADGTVSSSVSMTLFGPEAPDGSVPTLLLNPAMWSQANGPCSASGAGALCIWGQGDQTTLEAAAFIAPTMIVASDITPAAEPAVAADTATEAEPEVIESTPPAPVADGLTPNDGTWQVTVTDPAISNCPAGVEMGLSPVAGALAGSREIAWSGRFDPSQIGIDSTLPGVVWQAVSDVEARGESAPGPIEGQPPFIMGIVTADLTLSDRDKITGLLSLGVFSSGAGLAGLVNVGLAQCKVTAEVTMTRKVN